MKNTNKHSLATILTISLAIFLGLAACDVIDRPYEEVGPDNEAELPLVPRNVLLEEFTGFKCANCPLAADLMKILKDKYGHVELLTIHWGIFANTLNEYPNEKDMKTETGKNIHDQLGIFAYPLVAVSRYDRNGTGRYGVSPGKMESDMLPLLFDAANGDDLPGDESNRVTEYSDVDIQTSAVISGNTITIDTRLLYLAQSGTEDHLVHYVVEDSIIAAQLDGRVKENGGLIENYVHTNVLRDNVNGVWGQAVGNEILARGDSLTFSSNYTVSDATWDKEKLYILSLVTDGNAGPVKHVVKSKVVKE